MNLHFGIDEFIIFVVHIVSSQSFYFMARSAGVRTCNLRYRRPCLILIGLRARCELPDYLPGRVLSLQSINILQPVIVAGAKSLLFLLIVVDVKAHFRLMGGLERFGSLIRPGCLVGFDSALACWFA